MLPALAGCDQNSQTFLASAFLRQVQAMRLEMAGVRQAQDVECIHRMRVASRRARNLLTLMTGCVPKKRLLRWGVRLREITRALGAARDADVQIEILAGFANTVDNLHARPGLRRLLLRLRQQRTRLQSGLLQALDALEHKRSLEKIEEQVLEMTTQGEIEATPSHLLYRRAAFHIQHCLDDFLSYAPFITDPANVKELHAMRISAKHLRYSLETFAPLFGDGLQEEIKVVRKVQESLGTVHDCDVWGAYLPEFLEKERAKFLAFYGQLRGFSALLPGVNLFAQDRVATRQSAYLEFIRLWDKWASLWDALRRRLHLPLLPDQIYPPAGGECQDA